MTSERGYPSFHLLDAAALVVGYSVASLLVRAYWPPGETPGAWSILIIGLVYLWLGLAMSGPIVILMHRPAASNTKTDEETPEPRTWAELAWMMIGFYWIGLTILVVPVRVQGARFLDSAVLGVFPVVAALALRVFGMNAAKGVAGPGRPSWTHQAGVALLWSWPFAWVGLIVLGKTLL